MPPSPSWDDAYDPEDDGPEAQLFRRLDEEERRADQRMNAMLAAIERDGDPVEQGRLAAARMWDEVQALLRT
jgi:hypothetical protein